MYSTHQFNILTYRGCQITSPPVVSGGFVGQVKTPGGGLKIAVLLEDLTPPPWFQENFLDMSNRGGGSNLTPTVIEVAP